MQLTVLYFQRMQLKIFGIFKRIIIMLSADGIKKGFEYSRYPEWSVYENTLQRYVDAGITPTISYGVSVYSIFNLIESIEYYYSKNIPWLNIVYDANTSIAFANEIKKEITDKIKNEFKPSEFYTTRKDNRRHC